MSRIMLISMSLLWALVAQAQPLDTLKIKAEADSLMASADSLRESSQNEEALEKYNTALTKYQQIGYREEEATTLRRLANLFYDCGNFQEALTNGEEALKIFQEIGSKKEASSCMRLVGMSYWNLSDNLKALEYFQQSLTIAKALNDQKGQGKTLNNTGLVYDKLLDYSKALYFYKQSIEKFRELGDRVSECLPLNNIGMVHFRLSNYPEALEYFQQSLAIARELEDQRSESMVLNNIGMVYFDLSDYQMALEYYQRGLKIDRELGDLNGEGGYLNNIGNVYLSLKDYTKSLECLQRSLEIHQEIGDQSGEAYTLSNIGMVYYNIPEYSKALDYLQRSLTIDEQLGDLSKNETLAMIGCVCLSLKRYAEAIELCKTALVNVKELKTTFNIQKYYELLGHCYRAQNLDSLAMMNYAEAIKTAEKIRSKLEVESQKSSYSAGISSLYEKLVLIYLKLNLNDAAYNYIERSRARSFLDLLGGGKVQVGKSRHEEFLCRENEFQRQKQEIEEQITAAGEDSAKIAILRGKLETEWASISALTEETKRYEPELASLVTVNPLTLPEVQRLLDKESTILEYFLTKEKTLIWLITRDRAEVFQIEVGGDSLKNLVKGYRDALVLTGQEEYLSRDLYDLLIAPVGEKIKTEKLVIIPHGVLHYLPFQALQEKKGDYLLDHYQISYLPSASVLKYLQAKKRPKGDKLLALGDPRTDREGYGRLPLSVQEVKDIAQLYPANQVLTGAAATEEDFRKLAPQYDVLHLACHSELNSAYPMFSGLLLAPGEEQDGELDVHEIFTLDLKAYLVTLSACQTGLGHLTNGDELVGLSRAFIYAGTPSVLSSLWVVEDESTAYLMTEFYQELKKHDKAEALRRAQIETRKKYPHPYSWAGFVLIGEAE